MQFDGLLAVLMTMATALERTIEFIKPLYIWVKNKVTKANYQDCSKTEKIVMSIVLGPLLCLAAGVGIDIPKVDEAPFFQYLLAGLTSSLGSNFLHSTLSIAVALKDAAEGYRETADRQREKISS